MSLAMIADPAIDAETERAVGRFIMHEAQLLDRRKFNDWCALYTDDCVYWAPVDPEMSSPQEGVSHFHDDKQLMMARVHRLLNPRVFSPEPAPRTTRIVGNILPEFSDDGAIRVLSSLMVMEYRLRDRFEDDTRMFGANVEHHLKRTDSGFSIHYKRIDLINADGAFNAIAVPF